MGCPLAGVAAHWALVGEAPRFSPLSLSHSCAFPAESRRSQRAGEPLEMSDILRELLRVSEKAANIARACRQQEALFQLLVQEKKDAEKNKKFATDFKTLADVLVQEVIKQNMENKVRGQDQGGCEPASATLSKQQTFY